jgi:uncharacterized protein YjbI with pentapeptide repeats
VANTDSLAKLQCGVHAWNAWREEHPEIFPDLTHAELKGANLDGANLALICAEPTLRGLT